MGIPSHLSCLLTYLFADQEAKVRTGHVTMDWFKSGKAVHQGYILSPRLLNFYAEYIICNAEPDESQATVQITGRNIWGF